MIKGKATRESTDALAQENTGSYTYIKRPGVWISQIGFGTQRVSLADPDNYQAMKKALKNGINLIDTSANYGQGEAERLIGKVLADLDAEGVSRSQFFVVSKAGLIDGRLFEEVQSRAEAGNPYDGVLEMGRGFAYCMGADFIEAQITASLDRLGLETIDCFMLHNPESILAYFEQKKCDHATAYADYLERFRAVFVHLEKEVARGRISSYGISCNTLTSDVKRYGFTSLSDVWQLAQDITEDHHFGLVEMPMNLLETNAVLKANQPNGQTVADFALDRGIGILVNRVLDAFVGDKWLRLIDIAATEEDIGDLELFIDQLNDLEEDLIYKLLPAYDLPGEQLRPLKQLLSVGILLDKLWSTFSSLVHWQENRAYFSNMADQGVETLLTHPRRPDSAQVMTNLYLEQMRKTFNQLSAHYRNLSAAQIKQIKSLLLALKPNWEPELSMSRMAMRALREEQGIGCVLLGMRKESYVNEALNELHVSVSNSLKTRSDALRLFDQRLEL